MAVPLALPATTSSPICKTISDPCSAPMPQSSSRGTPHDQQILGRPARSAHTSSRPHFTRRCTMKWVSHKLVDVLSKSIRYSGNIRRVGLHGAQEHAAEERM